MMISPKAKGATGSRVSAAYAERPRASSRADASRRRLLDRLLGEDGQTLGEMCQGLDMTRQAVAKHLSILEEANLVSWKRQGREKLHFINPVPINDIAERWIGKFERGRLAALADLKKKLEREG